MQVAASEQGSGSITTINKSSANVQFWQEQQVCFTPVSH
jgi:hypothetical protein